MVIDFKPLQTWGEAYKGDATPSLYAFRSFASADHEIPMDAQLLHFQHQHGYHAYGAKFNVFGGGWPSATEHPLFYVAIYASIGIASALTNILSVTAQYTGALRASRILFKYVDFVYYQLLPSNIFRQLLVTVVRATFRFHDTTPQGTTLENEPSPNI